MIKVGDHVRVDPVGYSGAESIGYQPGDDYYGVVTMIDGTQEEDVAVIQWHVTKMQKTAAAEHLRLHKRWAVAYLKQVDTLDDWFEHVI